MNMTIYGGVTANGLTVDDMVPNWNDIVYRPQAFGIGGGDGYFVRVSQTYHADTDSYSPAIVLFHEDSPYLPLWAMELDGVRSDYIDESGGLRIAAVEFTKMMFLGELNRHGDSIADFLLSATA